MKLSKLELTRKDPTRVSLFCEEGFLLAVPLRAVADFNLKQGMELSGELLEQLERYDAGHKAVDRAALLLGQRAHGAKELERKLKEKGFTPEQSSAAVEQMKRQGYLDDTAFAQTLCRHLWERGHGPRRMAQELHARGVDREAAQTALDDYREEDLLRERIAAVIGQKARAPLNDKKERDRLGAVLVRYGYDASLIRSVLGTLRLDEEDA